MRWLCCVHRGREGGLVGGGGNTYNVLHLPLVLALIHPSEIVRSWLAMLQRCSKNLFWQPRQHVLEPRRASTAVAGIDLRPTKAQDAVGLMSDPRIRHGRGQLDFLPFYKHAGDAHIVFYHVPVSAGPVSI